MEKAESTKWQVITGGPSSGKSKVIEAISFRGLLNRPESARILIDEELSQGKDLLEIRAEEAKFQERVLDLSIDVQKKANRNEVIFWERGVPDSIAYLSLCQGNVAKALEASRKVKYQNIFLLDRLPIYKGDYARTETEKEAAEIHEKLFQVYLALGYSVICVPVLCISKRVDFILQKI